MSCSDSRSNRFVMLYTGLEQINERQSKEREYFNE